MDRTERLRIEVAGAADLAALQQKAAAARTELAALATQLAELKAAQAKISSGTITPALLKQATGGSGAVDPSKLEGQMADAQKAASAKVLTAKKAVIDADKAATQFVTLQNRALQQYIDLMGKSTVAADREWAAQQKLNQQRQKAQDLAQQVGGTVPTLGEGGGASASGGNRAGGMAAGAVRQGLYALGGATGIPGAGMAASALGGAIEGLSVPIIGAIGVGLAGLAVALGVNTLGATLAGYGQTLGGSAALGNGPNARTDYARAILEQGRSFLVDVNQNNANAQAMGQIGVSAQDIAGNKATGKPSALALSYAVGTNAGMDLGQSAQMVAEYMVKTGSTVSQASQAFQLFAKAAGAAGISLQRMNSLLQTQLALGESPTLNPGQMASLQKQLGLGVNPAQLLAPALTATGVQAKAQAAMLGISEQQLYTEQQHAPAQLFDQIAQKAKAASGGSVDTLETTLGIYGMDLSSLNVTQQHDLAQKIMTGTPGQALAYYNQFVKAGANQPTTGTNALIAHEAKVKAGMTSGADSAKTQAAYDALLLGHRKPPPGPLPPADYTPSAQHPIPTPKQPDNGTVAPPGMIPKGQLTPPPASVTSLSATLPPALRPYAAYYAAASKATGVPVAVLAAQDMVESSGKATALNAKTGAAGLGQIMPSNFAALGLTASTVMNPQQNISGTAQMDATLFKQLGSWQAVFAGYNEGAGGFQSKGYAGTEPGYMSKINDALQLLAGSGVDVNVTVTVKDSQGHTMPSTSTTKKGPTTSPHRPPGH